MREILFRGKRADNGEWVEGYLCRKYFQDPPHDRLVIQYKPKYKAGRWAPDYMVAEVVPDTVGQYLGTRDKNRKRIFEGDIVQRQKTEFNPPRKYREPYVVYYNSDFPKAVDEYYSPTGYFTEPVDYEVIGTIHDNPGLLVEVRNE